MRTGSAASVTVLAPGLFGPDRGVSNDPSTAHALVDGLDLGALDRLLARATWTVESAADDSLEALIFRSFGYPARPLDTDWPVAAATSLIDYEANENSGSLRVDPVRLYADISDLVLFTAADIRITRDEARALAAIANDALRPIGPLIDAVHPHRWYVALDAPTRMTTTPLSLVAGAKISSVMPRGPDAPQWHRWMSEVQIALHDCSVNLERERRGAPPINSVWPWGGGNLPPVSGAPFTQVWGDDALVHGLARRAGIACDVLAAGADAGFNHTRPSGAHLIVYDALYHAVGSSDIDAWRTELTRFNALWAEPLLRALDRGFVACLSIHDERGHRFVATRRGRLRWWRRGGLAAKIAAYAPIP